MAKDLEMGYLLDFARKKLPEHAHPVLSVLNTNTRAIELYTDVYKRQLENR